MVEAIRAYQDGMADEVSGDIVSELKKREHWAVLTMRGSSRFLKDFWIGRVCFEGLTKGGRSIIRVL